MVKYISNEAELPVLTLPLSCACVDISDIMAQIGLPIRQFYAHYPEEDRVELQDAFARHNDLLQSKGVPFFDGVKEMLLSLKKYVK